MTRLNSLAPRLIRQTSDEVDRLAQRRKKEIIDESSQKVEKMTLKAIRGAIEDVYKTPFRLLGTFGRNHLSQGKKKLKKICKRSCVGILLKRMEQGF